MAPDKNKLEEATARLERDPFFMAFVLAKYKLEMQVNNQQLAKDLACSVQALTKLALCRAPRVDDPKWLSSDVKTISEYVACDPSQLAKIVRAVQSFQNLQSFAERSDRQLLMAAREKRRKTPHKRSKRSKRDS